MLAETSINAAVVDSFKRILLAFRVIGKTLA
jgi:hypothetical protein